jgi:hypothetical protein
VLANLGADSKSPEQVKIQNLDPLLFRRIRELDARVSSLCGKDILTNASAAEQMMHELQTVVIGMAADLIARNPQFHTDYRRALSSVGLQCTDRICQGTLSILGTALGYAAWLEIIASAIVLWIYFRIFPEQSKSFIEMTTIASEQEGLGNEPPGLLRAVSDGRLGSGRGGRREAAIALRSVVLALQFRNYLRPVNEGDAEVRGGKSFNGSAGDSPRCKQLNDIGTTGASADSDV